MNDEGFSSPFFVLYYSHSFLALLVPALKLFDLILWLKQRRTLDNCDGSGTTTVGTDGDEEKAVVSDQAKPPITKGGGGGGHLFKLAKILDSDFDTDTTSERSSSWLRTYGHVFFWLFWLSLLYTFPSYLWYVGLDLTLVSKVTGKSTQLLYYYNSKTLLSIIPFSLIYLVIFNSYVLFTFIFSVIILKDPVTVTKVMGCLASILGVALLSLPFTAPVKDGKNPVIKNDTLGVTVTCVSAVTYGLYLVMYKKAFSKSHHSSSRPEYIVISQDSDPSVTTDSPDNPCPNSITDPPEIAEDGAKPTIDTHDDDVDDEEGEEHCKESRSSTYKDIYSSLLVTGWLGVFTLISHWPILFILHYSGLEPFNLPSAKIILALCFNGMTTTIYNTFYMLSIVMLSPLTCSVTILITIPLSIAIEHYNNTIIDGDGGAIKDTLGSNQIIGFIILLLAIWAINKK